MRRLVAVIVAVVACWGLPTQARCVENPPAPGVLEKAQRLLHDVRLVGEFVHTRTTATAAEAARMKRMVELLGAMQAQSTLIGNPDKKEQAVGEIQRLGNELLVLFKPAPCADHVILIRALGLLQPPGGQIKEKLEQLAAKVGEECAKPAAVTYPLPGRAMNRQPVEVDKLNIKEYLLDAYAEYRRLAREGKRDSSADEALDSLRDALYVLLEQEGLRPQLIGYLVPAIGATRMSDTGEPQSDEQGALIVRFVSRRMPIKKGAWAEAMGLDANLMGKVGIAPILTVMVPTATATATELTEEQSAYARLSNGVVWDFGARLGASFGSSFGEGSVVVRGGQTITLSSLSVIEKGYSGKPVIVGPANGNGDAAFYRELGLRFTIYRSSWATARELGIIDPLFELELGDRRDWRFEKDDKDLTRKHLSAWTSPEKRRYLRLVISGLRVIPAAGEAFQLSFGVDHEWAAGTGWFKPGPEGLPRVTRLFLQGNLNMQSLFKKSE